MSRGVGEMMLKLTGVANVLPGERIRKARKAAGLTQKQLAELLGFSSDLVILRWEKAVREPDLSTLKRIADALHVSMAYLLGETEIPYEFKVQKGRGEHPGGGRADSQPFAVAQPAAGKKMYGRYAEVTVDSARYARMEDLAELRRLLQAVVAAIEKQGNELVKAVEREKRECARAIERQSRAIGHLTRKVERTIKRPC